MEGKETKKKYTERQLIIFTIDKEEFGVNINEVNCIIKMEPITRIPNSPDFIEGVINLRGKIIVVVNLAKKLGITETKRNKDTRIIVVEKDDTMMGMIVDQAREAIRISEENIEPAPPIIAQKIDSEYLEGVGIVDERLLILLDLSKVLSEKEMVDLTNIDTEGSQ